MKKTILFIFAVTMSMAAYPQNVIFGGNMENGNVWDVIDVNEVAGTVEFGYTNDVPAAGEGGALHISGNAINTIVYQAVELEEATYVLDAAFKTIADMNESWNEIQITSEEPEPGVDVNADFAGYVYLTGFKFADWVATCTNYIDASIATQEDCATGIGDTIEIAEAGTYFLSLKSGGFQDVDVVFDEVSFTNISGTSGIATPTVRFGVFPNPTSGVITIDSQTEVQSAVVYSVMGSEIMSMEVSNNKVDISDISNGIYFIEIVDINNNKGIQKITKN